MVCTRYGPPEVLQLRELETPVPKRDQLCIRVLAAAATSSDCFVRGFNVSWRFRLPMALAIGFTGPRQPILGIVFAGEVASIGEGVLHFKPGDPVFGWDLFPGFGAYAEFKCISERRMVAPKPSNLGFDGAAALPYGGLMALAYLRKCGVRHGQKILIYGASGAVGTSAVQLARHFGADVTGVCGPGNIDLVRSLGAGEVLDYTKDDLAAGGARYDVVFDAVGKKKSSKMPLKGLLAGNGRLMSVDDGSPKVDIKDLILLKELAETGALKPVIDRRYPLERLAEAHRYVELGHKKGNVIIEIAQATQQYRGLE